MAGIEWVIGTNALTKNVFITTDNGRIDFPVEEAAAIAAALAQYSRDDDERAFVAGEWGPL